MGKILIIMGVVLVVSGLVIQYSDRLSFFGKLPGDIRIERGNFSLYLPLATSILLSILLSVVLYLINRFRN
jgi:hypothetical protein